MTDAVNSSTDRQFEHAGAETRPIAVVKLSRKHGLRLGDPSALTIRRVKRGTGFAFVAADGRTIRNARTITRLKSLAVPPAYQDVRFADDPDAHLQATGRDAAGRLQYRYHPDWEKVREARKAHRLAQFVAVLPRIRRSVAQHLAAKQPTREFAHAAVIELVARTAIRPGHESYARIRNTRGATTLLKSNISIERDSVMLSFRGKGGKTLHKECNAARLVRAIKLLRGIPGSRLFQYVDDGGAVHRVTAAQVNEFLRIIAGVGISLKDFRTLMASAAVLESLSRVTPAESARGRRRQVLEAVRKAADELANTPAICRKSYVHDSVVTAFERGLLERFSATLRSCRAQSVREQVLGQVLSLGQV
jgi:DNA topoisomerase I